MTLTPSRRAELLDSARKRKAEETDRVSAVQAAVAAKEAQLESLVRDRQLAELYELQSDLARERSRIERLESQRDSMKRGNFQTWWTDLVSSLLPRKQQQQEHGELSQQTMNSPTATFAQLSQLHNLIRQRDRMLLLTSRENASVIEPKSSNSVNININSGGGPLLSEALSMLRECAVFDRKIRETEQGPLHELRRRHRDLDIAIADTEAETHRLNMEFDRIERLQLIARYRSEIPLLRQDLASRPKASEVHESRERMQQQAATLSAELSRVLEDLAMVSEESTDGLQRKIDAAKAESDALAVELTSLQEQCHGLVSYEMGQRDQIRVWQQTEEPRHENFIQTLERERDELLDRCIARGLASPRRKGDDAGGDQAAAALLDMSGSFTSASPTKRVVEVVHFDNENQTVRELQQMRAPRAKVRFIAKKSDDGDNEQRGAAAAAASAGQQSNSNSSSSNGNSSNRDLFSQVLSTLRDIYLPPLADYTAKKRVDDADADVGARDATTLSSSAKAAGTVVLPHKPPAASLTVRVLSALSLRLFGAESWVVKGRHEQKSNVERTV